MGKESKIQWTDNTWNPWHGCIKVSPGCARCYMYRDKERYKQDPTIVLRSRTGFNAPLTWQGTIDRNGFSAREGKTFPGMKIFTCSWSDWLIKEADPWRMEANEIVEKTPEFIYQILTKRIERSAEHSGYEKWPNNVWLGVSVETQDQWKRMEILCETNASTRFLSLEPLLGPIDLVPIFDSYYQGIKWVIVGGESGNETGKYRYRECKLEWIENIIDQCHQYDVPVFVKQLGTHLAKELGLKDRHGGDISEWPERFRIRQFPKSYTK